MTSGGEKDVNESCANLYTAATGSFSSAPPQTSSNIRDALDHKQPYTSQGFMTPDSSRPGSLILDGTLKLPEQQDFAGEFRCYLHIYIFSESKT